MNSRLKVAGRRAFPVIAAIVAVSIASCCLSAFPLRKRQPEFAGIEILAARPGCAVDIDGSPVGLTRADGNLSFTGVSPSAHYVHVDCKGGAEETYFISPHAGSTLKLTASGQRSPAAAQPSSLAAGEQTMEVRSLFHEAADFRSNGQFPETIGVLRRAIEIDPGNPNLHHELATTFLMIRDWEDARVELLEAVRHDPNSAGLHNDLGYALEKLGEIRPALDEFRLATKLDPADTSYRDQYFEALGLLAAQQPGKKKRQRNR